MKRWFFGGVIGTVFVCVVVMWAQHMLGWDHINQDESGPGMLSVAGVLLVACWIVTAAGTLCSGLIAFIIKRRAAASALFSLCGGVWLGGVVAMCVVMLIQAYWQNAEMQQIADAHAEVPAAIERYRADHDGKLPTSLDALPSKYLERTPELPEFCQPFILDEEGDDWAIWSDCDVERDNYYNKSHHTDQRLIYKRSTGKWVWGEWFCCATNDSSLRLREPFTGQVNF